MKEKTLDREGYITVLTEVTFQGFCLMERDSSLGDFGFEIDVIGSTIRPTIVNKLAVIVLQHIMTPSFISLDMFDIVVPYLFAV